MDLMMDAARKAGMVRDRLRLKDCTPLLLLEQSPLDWARQLTGALPLRTLRRLARPNFQSSAGGQIRFRVRAPVQQVFCS